MCSLLVVLTKMASNRMLGHFYFIAVVFGTFANKV